MGEQWLTLSSPPPHCDRPLLSAEYWNSGNSFQVRSCGEPIFLYSPHAFLQAQPPLCFLWGGPLPSYTYSICDAFCFHFQIAHFSHFLLHLTVNTSSLPCEEKRISHATGGAWPGRQSWLKKRQSSFVWFVHMGAVRLDINACVMKAVRCLYRLYVILSTDAIGVDWGESRQKLDAVKMSHPSKILSPRQAQFVDLL